jgi:AcrR family transcriptional regulator
MKIMEPEPAQPRRGRPRKITREAIADAGRRLTLPKATLADVANELGVGVRALYKHTDGIADIQVITAEAIFASWEAPVPQGESLAEHLMHVALSLRTLALENPGIAGFLVRASTEVSPAVVQAMDAHQQSVARAYGLSLTRSSVLLGTVAEHALAVTDIVNASGGRRRDAARMSADERFPALSASARRSEARDPESTFRFGVRALIRGLLEVTDEMTDVTPNEGNETHERSVDTTADTAPGP